MNNIQEMVNFTIDAIVASGKKFESISRESVVSFLTNTQGLTKKEAEKVYNKIGEALSVNSKKPNSLVYHDEPLKQKTPRKTVFSEIKKITK